MKQHTLAFTISLILGSQAASANPSGAQVVYGTATFSAPSADVLNITNSNNAIINWQSFNIGVGQTTNFIQPSSSSSVLNRVVSNNPSQLLGNLNSNGNVFLINQNGLLVGDGAQINTAGFFGSTLNITDSDYLNGNLRFEGGGNGGISNQGYIHAGESGNIVLIAPNIENGGVIEVDDGHIILAAGKSITISSLENPAIQFEVTGSENTVTNLGMIVANQGSASLFAGSLQHSGSIRAGGLVQNADGTISLVAKNTSQVSGSVDASGSEGGYIEILGDSVTIDDGASVNASGETAGGEILIGGDQQGLNPEVQNATSTTIAAGASVNADANTTGNGGKVIVFANEDVHVHGEVTARGGAISGDGGFIETSGLLSLDITSAPDASALNGKGGEWLIDPNNITIVNATSLNISGVPDFISTDDTAILDANLINFALNNGNSVTITTGDADADNSSGGAGTEVGNITIQASIQKTTGSNASLTLNAHNNITVDSTGSIIDITSSSGVMDVTFNADSDRDGNGSVFFDTGTGNSFSSTINTNGGSFITNTDVTINGDVLNTSSAVNILNSQWVIPFQTSVHLNEDLVLNAPGTVVQNNGEIIIGDSSAIYYPTLNISGDTLNLAPGSLLSGFGYLTGNVDVNGGVIMGGDGSTSFGTLTINGDLNINSGALYTVLSAPDGMIASDVVATTVTINGGDLIMNWEDSAAVTGAVIASNPVSVVSCTGTGCLQGSGFNTIVDPIATTSQGSVSNVIGTQEAVSYTIGNIDAGNLINWTGQVNNNWNVAGNWDTGIVPDANSDVFINSATGIDITSAAVTVRGIQAHGQINVGAGGSLDFSGNAFILDPTNASGGLAISAADAVVSRTGTGVLYNLGATLYLDQGILSADTVNWGSVHTSAATAFQLDSNLVNNALFAIDASTGNNDFIGTGSIDNNAIMSWGNGAHLSLDGISLSVSSANAQFQGNGVLALANAAQFNINNTPGFYDTAITWDINGGIVSGIGNIATLPTSVQLSGGGQLTGTGSVDISNATTFTVAGGGFVGTDIQTPLDVNVLSSIQVLQGQSLSLNNTSLTINPGASLTGGGGITINTGSTLNTDGLINIAQINLLGGNLFTNSQLNYAGNILWDGGTIGGAGIATFGHVDLVSGILNTDWRITSAGTVNWLAPDTAVLQINNATITNQGEFTISSYVDIAAQVLAAKNFSTSVGAAFINEGLLIIDSDAFPGIQASDVIVFDLVFDNVGGTIGIKSGTFRIESAGVAQDLQLDAGESLQGFGTFDGNVINAGGTVSPGKSDVAAAVYQTGTLTITGNYIQQANGNLVIKMDSTANGLVHDRLNVGGELNAGGSISFTVINGKTPAQLALLLDQSFKPISYASFANRFDTVNIPPGLNFTFSDTGFISISSDSQLLNDIANQLEVLFDNRDLNHRQMVHAMKFIDRGASILKSDEEEDEKKRAPRLVCR